MTDIPAPTAPTALPRGSDPRVAERWIGPFRLKRLAVVLILFTLAVLPGDFGDLTRGLMTDAYVQVSAFVAATLMLFYGAERLFRFDLGDVLRTSRGFQVPLAALLGATPGCGGAVVVVAAYSSGNVGFGAVVATLTSTMGDAAFLLIATRPDAALVVLPLSFVVGVLAGWIADWLIRKDFRDGTRTGCDLAPRIGRIRPKDLAYLALAIPGLGLGVMQLAQIDSTTIFGSGVMMIGLAGTAIGLFIWSTSPLQAMTHAADSPVTRMAEETSFISIWVIGAYLAYDYVITILGIDLGTLFQSVAPLLPLIAILIGFVPGCGPQVLVATMYINGLIPFSALIGNAISNDGDALFPAIALNPKAAITATAVTAVPALIVAYGFYFLAPGFL
jgi:hypothetical protein